MGIIDTMKWKLTCPNCAATDAVSARQKGSMYSAGPWSDIGESAHFESVSKPDDTNGPDSEFILQEVQDPRARRMTARPAGKRATRSCVDYPRAGRRSRATFE